MTRTEMLFLAQQIIHNPVDAYDDFGERGTIYTGTHRKKAISVFLSFRNIVVAVAYNGVCYFLNPTDLSTSQNLRAFCSENKVHTKVFLYPRSRQLFCDVDGSVDDKIDMKISKAIDYADVIPIKF